MPETNQSTTHEQREAWMKGLMEIRITLVVPLFDTADGMRADLRARGWSESTAELMAGAWLASMLAKVGAA